MRSVIKASILLILLSCLFVNSSGMPHLRENSTFVISKKYDLKGRVLKIPKGVTLSFKGGYLRNGVLVGADTKITGECFHIFDNIDIQGTWLVPSISSNMFCDLSKDNSLRIIMALTNKKIKNIVTVEQGIYNFCFKTNEESGLLVEDNTILDIKGVLTISPNPFVNYQIVRTQGENILVKGCGILIGDKDKHTGEKGQWGMGIDVYESKNVKIKDLTITNCWGDCIYIGHNSYNISVDNCNLYGSRRQGISVTEAKGVTLKNSQIYNISGTLPGFAIDVEPNKNCRVENVVIENITMSNCNGGIELNGNAPNSYVKNVLVKNCTIYNMSEKYLVQCYDCQDITFTNCKIDEIIKYILFKNCENAKKEKITVLN